MKRYGLKFKYFLSGVVLFFGFLIQSFVYAGATYDELDGALRDPKQAYKKEALLSVLRKFHEDALSQNQDRGRRTSFSRKIIYLLSGAPQKTREFAKFLSPYHIEVFRAPPADNDLYRELILTELNSKTDHDSVDGSAGGSAGGSVQVLAVLKEDSSLEDPISQEDYTKCFSGLPSGLCLCQTSLLNAYFFVGQVIQHKAYAKSVEGKVVCNPSLEAGEEVYGWDGDVAVDGLTKPFTFHQLKKMGYNTPREMTLSHLLLDLGLLHNSLFQGEVQFGDSSNISLDGLNPDLAREWGILSLIHTVLNEGVSFVPVEDISPRLHRQKKENDGYLWLTGLSSVIPIHPINKLINKTISESTNQPTSKNQPISKPISKEDLIQGYSDLIRLLSSTAIRDLIFTGTDSPEHRRVYITYRMVREAMSMVLAEMLVPDLVLPAQRDLYLKQSKSDLYRLFQATGLRWGGKDHLLTLKKLMKATAVYAVGGGDSGFRKLLGISEGQSHEILDSMKSSTYIHFVNLFRQVEGGYVDLVGRKEEVARSWKQIQFLEGLSGIHFESLDNFMEKLNLAEENLVDPVFEKVFEERISPIFSKQVEPMKGEWQKTAFSRYMAGQFAVFSRFEPLVLETGGIRQKIQDRLSAVIDQPNFGGQIPVILALYNNYLSLLMKKSLLSQEDVARYSVVYPFVKGLSTPYDSELASNEVLWRRIFGSR